MIRDVEWTVLIVDDHREFRSVARALLESEGFRFVGEASDGASAIVAAEQLHPDVVLLDIQLPDLDGLLWRSVLPPDRSRCRRSFSSPAGRLLHTSVASPAARRSGSSPRATCRALLCPQCSRATKNER